MKNLLLAGIASAALFATINSASAATEITVNDIGSILNESLSLPANDTPGLGISFADFFEFTLPVRETVTLSMTDSATGLQRITGGVLALSTWTSTSGVAPFIPLGALLESSPIANFIGGQGATVTPDVLGAGNYFALVSGTSGLSPLHIAVDGTVTASTVPETSTWAMMALGFAAIVGLSLYKRKPERYMKFAV